MVDIAGRRYRIVEIIGQGNEKIVFGLADLGDGSRERVLAVYRRRMTEAFRTRKESATQKLRDHGVPVADMAFHYIGDWLFAFGQRYAGSIHAGAANARRRMDPVYERCRVAAELLDAGDHTGVLRVVEAALDTHPLQPDLLYLAVLSQCGLGDVHEAAGLARQWLDVGDDPDQLRDIVMAVLRTGAPRSAFGLASAGADVVPNGLAIRRLVCDLAIDHFGSVPAARAARDALAAAGATDLAEVDARIHRLTALTAELDRYAEPGTQGADEFAERAVADWPYEAHVNRLLGFTRYQAGQWAECIDPLLVASSHERYDSDIAITLGLAYLRCGEAAHARGWWSFWAHILTEAARRILDELAVPGPGRIEIEQPHEAYVVLRRDIAIDFVGVVREAVPRLLDDGVPPPACAELARELAELGHLLRAIPDPGAERPE